MAEEAVPIEGGNRCPAVQWEGMSRVSSSGLVAGHGEAGPGQRSGRLDAPLMQQPFETAAHLPQLVSVLPSPS